MTWGEPLLARAPEEYGGSGEVLIYPFSTSGSQGTYVGRKSSGTWALQDVFDVQVFNQAWGARMEAPQMTPREAGPPWTLEARGLRMQIIELEHRTETELRRLSTLVERLRHTVETSVPRAVTSEAYEHDFSFAYVRERDLETARENDVLADLFSLIAEEGLESAPEVRMAMVEGLRSRDPQLRAASARALAATYYVDAQLELRRALETETNRFVAAILRSAIAS
jgi:hypothetical protein